MCLFCKKKKKKNYTALKVVACVVSVLAVLAAGYVVFDKFKDKIMSKLPKKKCACVEDACEDTCEDVIAEVTEAEICPEEAEATETTDAE